jgi:hypothetical protein
MKRSEALGLGASALVHGGAVLLFSFAWHSLPLITPPRVIDVQIVDKVGLEAAAPALTKAAPAPDTAQVQERDKSQPASKPIPQPQHISKPQASTHTQAKTQAAKPSNKDAMKALLAALHKQNGVTDKPNATQSRNLAATHVSAQQMASITSLIQQKANKCARDMIQKAQFDDTAYRIKTDVILRLRPDGSLASAPQLGQQSGVGDDNRRYAEIIARLAKAAFTKCAPYDNLPPDLYKTASGEGWYFINLHYRLGS